MKFDLIFHKTAVHLIQQEYKFPVKNFGFMVFSATPFPACFTFPSFQISGLTTIITNHYYKYSLNTFIPFSKSVSESEA